MEEQTFDVVVIGGGAAGLSGALALVRSRRSVLVVDSGEPRNAPAAHMHNFLGRDGTPPGDLLVAGRDEVAGYGGRFVDGRARSAVFQNGRLCASAETVVVHFDQTTRKSHAFSDEQRSKLEGWISAG